MPQKERQGAEGIMGDEVILENTTMVSLFRAIIKLANEKFVKKCYT